MGLIGRSIGQAPATAHPMTATPTQAASKEGSRWRGEGPNGGVGHQRRPPKFRVTVRAIWLGDRHNDAPMSAPSWLIRSRPKQLPKQAPDRSIDRSIQLVHFIIISLHLSPRARPTRVDRSNARVSLVAYTHSHACHGIALTTTCAAAAPAPAGPHHRHCHRHPSSLPLPLLLLLLLLLLLAPRSTRAPSMSMAAASPPPPLTGACWRRSRSVRRDHRHRRAASPLNKRQRDNMGQSVSQSVTKRPTTTPEPTTLAPKINAPRLSATTRGLSCVS